MKSLDRIRKEVRRIKGQAKMARYPEELVDEIINHVNSGIKITEVSEATGIAHQTIRGWVANASETIPVHRFPQKGKKTTFKLHYPDGSWVEGLSLTDLKELWLNRAVSKKGA